MKQFARKLVGAMVLFGVIMVLAIDYCLFAFDQDTISDVAQEYLNKHGKQNWVSILIVASASFAAGMLANHFVFQF